MRSRRWFSPGLLGLGAVFVAAGLLAILPKPDVLLVRDDFESLTQGTDDTQRYLDYLADAGFEPVQVKDLIGKRPYPGGPEFAASDQGFLFPCAMWPPDWLLQRGTEKQCFSKKMFDRHFHLSEAIVVCFESSSSGNVASLSIGHVDTKNGRGTWEGALLPEDMESDRWCAIAI